MVAEGVSRSLTVEPFFGAAGAAAAGAVAGLVGSAAAGLGASVGLAAAAAAGVLVGAAAAGAVVGLGASAGLGASVGLAGSAGLAGAGVGAWPQAASNPARPSIAPLARRERRPIGLLSIVASSVERPSVRPPGQG